MANRAFSASSNSLKAATVILLVVLVIHIVGFSLPRWISVNLTILGHSSAEKTETGYHAGLWQHCACASFMDTGACLCFSRTNDPTWFTVVQASETAGLVGLAICLLLSVTMLFYEQNKKCKIVNVLILAVSGILMIIGLVIFKIKSEDAFDTFRDMAHINIRDISVGQVHIKLNYAYFLCGVAGCLSILVCAPIYLKDLCSPPPSGESSVRYTAQGECLVQGNTDTGYMSRPSDGQYGFPPAYEPRYVPNNADLPYKS